MILKDIVNLDDIWNDHNHYYDDMVKFCIDKKRGVVAIDELFEILKKWIR